MSKVKEFPSIIQSCYTLEPVVVYSGGCIRGRVTENEIFKAFFKMFVRFFLFYRRNTRQAWGSALRTGRTNDTYDDARQFSAKQRSGMPRNKYPSNDNISRYAK